MCKSPQAILKQPIALRNSSVLFVKINLDSLSDSIGLFSLASFFCHKNMADLAGLSRVLCTSACFLGKIVPS